jgi:hypothetical protein
MGNMRRYNVKCQPGKVEYIEIIKELDDEYIVRFTRLYDGSKKISEETMTRNLFNMCIQTGYLYQMAESSVA